MDRAIPAPPVSTSAALRAASENPRILSLITDRASLTPQPLPFSTAEPRDPGHRFCQTLPGG
eukprot:9219446-Pyramimonas_sp.AAC.1